MTENSDSTAIIVRPQVLPSTSQFQMMRELAERLAYAEGFLPKHFFQGDPRTRPHRVLAAIEYGRAVGIEPMIALQNITMIDGKAGASALLIGALLRRGGYDVTADYTANDQACVVTISKAGKVTGRGQFSMENARLAGLVRDGSGWVKYPRDMLYARALTQAARQGAQDAVLGMAYTSEELGLEVDADGQVTGEIPITQASPETVTALEEAVKPQAEPVSPAVTSEAVPVPQASGSDSTPPQVPTAAPERSARSVGPKPKRQNVVQAPTKPATVADRARQAPAPEGSGEPALAPPDLTDEDDEEDEGQRVYLNTLREDLRERAAMLARVNVLLKNHGHALKGEALEQIPPTTPSTASDEGLARLIDRDYPGRVLTNLSESELQNRLELVESNLAKKRELMTERGITE